MKEQILELSYRIYALDELPEESRKLVDAALEATRRSYAPYSHFYVGAAVKLDNGVIVTGNNQENVAFPSGLCAERTALFYANAQYPEVPVKALAIVARDSSGKVTQEPISPCGACRQVMLETENRFGKPMQILLASAEEVIVVERSSALLPLAFSDIS
jgi:cytidine deaminase